MSARYALQKVESALDLVAEFKSRAFPHQDSYEAVEELAGQLDELRTLLTKDGSQQTQIYAVVLISEVLDLLGVIGNSANVRNAFEVHGPFLALAQQLLKDEKARLILFRVAIYSIHLSAELRTSAAIHRHRTASLGRL